MSDSLAMTARGLRLTVRKPDALITGLTLPPMILLVFVYLFGGAVNTGTRYVTYVVPGILILGVFLSSAATAVTVCQDMTGGIIDRFRSMNVPGTAIIGGHVLASTARYAIAAALMLAIGYGIGFRAHATAGGALAAAGILLLFSFAVSWLCAAIGLAAKSAEAANAAVFLMFIAYASSAFVPVHTMPSWLRGFAASQPVTAVTETIRALLLGHPAAGHLVPALAWTVGIALVSAGVAAALFRRGTR